MKKDSTQNTFQNGIIQDIDPSQLPNNCLYSCLNGTYVTKDGNQYALQNDMGNIKVEQIKLPSGYVPVGLCDHGGITYIASYNPIENKGQIGSFPAPQENIFLSNENNIEDNITFNQYNSLQVSKQLFNSDQIIRPGDKFSLYVSEDNQLLNYKLISGATEKIDSCPKKRAISVSVCVLDSNGNLHDITNTLKRFKYSNFNSIFESLNNSTSSVDQNNLIPSNIYNCKITGPLYLVYTLNGIISTDISASFFKGPLDNISQFITLIEDPILEKIEVKENELCVLFDVTYKYNCPDGFYAQNYFRFNTLLNLKKKQLLNIYGDKYTYDPINIIKGILCKYNGKNTILPFNIPNSFSSLSTPTLNNNIYTSRQRYLLNGIDIQELKNLEFNLTPSLIYCPQNNLASSLNVNIEKLNSGEVSINQWKYFVDNNEITLTWGLNAYPFVGTRLSNVKLKFYNLLSTNTTINSKLELSRIEQENTFYYDQDDWGNSIQLNEIYTINNQKIQNNQLSFDFNMKIPISEIKNIVSDYKDFGQGGYSPNSLSIDQITCTYSENNITQIELQNLKFEITTDNDNQEDPYCINEILSKINSIQFTSNELLSNEEYTFNNPQINVNTSFETDSNNEYLVLTGTFFINIIGKYGNYSNLEYVLPIEERSSYFGTFTNVITSLNKKSVYCVLLEYQLANEQNELYDTVYTAGVRTMFTTPLLNDLYTQYNDFNDLDTNTYEKYYTYNLNGNFEFVKTYEDKQVSTDPIIWTKLTEDSNRVITTKTDYTIYGEISSSYDTNTDNYPFDVTVISEDFIGEGVLNVSNSDYIFEANNITTKLNPGHSVEVDIDSKNNVRIYASGTSEYIGQIQNKNVTFSNALTQYFPLFNKNQSSPQYIKDQQQKLFGYDESSSSRFNVEGKKNQYPSDAYKIAYGITYRGLSGHLDHHGVKYIEVDRRGNCNSTEYHKYMSDLHSNIYGNKWYDGEDEVYKAGDTAKTFTLIRFLNNINVLDKYRDITFLYLDPEGKSNRNYKEHDKGHNNTSDIAGDDIYKKAVYNSEGTIEKEGISDFIVMDRKGADSWDEKIMKKGWYKILLWKYNNQWIMIKDSLYKLDSNSNQFVYSTPNLFTSKFSNIYVRNKNDVTLNNVSIYKPNVYSYNKIYDLNITKNFNMQVSYSIGDYIDIINKSLTNLNLNNNELVNKYTHFIFPNIVDNVAKETYTDKVNIKVNIEGAEKIASEIKTLASTSTYNKPTLIDQYNIYLSDNNNKDLLSNQAYELNKDDKLNKTTVQLFGTSGTNKLLSKYLSIEDSEIYPKNYKSISGQNLVQFINNDTDSNTDSDTSLFTGEINCLEIPLTNDNNKSE